MPRGVIAYLAGHLHEPYRKEEVLEAARALQPPFLLRELVAATGLPRHVVSRVLTRLYRQGVVDRRKAVAAFDHYAGKGELRPGGRQRKVYIYWFTEAAK